MKDERKPGLWRTIHLDLESFADLKGVRLHSPMSYLDVLMFPGVIAVILFRFTSFFHHHHLRPLSRLLYLLNFVLFSVELSPACQIGPGLALPHPAGVAIVGGARIGRRARIYQGVNIGGAAIDDETVEHFPTIGDDCWLFGSTWVVGPVKIGDRARIGIQSMVVRSIPAGAVAMGSPARVIRFLDGEAPASTEEAPAKVMAGHANGGTPRRP